LVLKLVQITYPLHPALHTLQKLYEEAFPAEERREFSQLLQLLRQPDIRFYAVMSGEHIAGLCIYWHSHNYYFLEHLAITQALRGQRLGRQVMLWLLEQANGKLVLEVERPIDEDSRRRISFYQQLGFTLHDTFNYQQPPYQKLGQPVPLYLMTSRPVPDENDLLYIADHIRRQVYERFYA
jgi:ribosomal protein S18 acetylase RimI-like enzyme